MNLDEAKVQLEAMTFEEIRKRASDFDILIPEDVTKEDAVEIVLIYFKGDDDTSDAESDDGEKDLEGPTEDSEEEEEKDEPQVVEQFAEFVHYQPPQSSLLANPVIQTQPLQPLQPLPPQQPLQPQQPQQILCINCKKSCIPEYIIKESGKCWLCENAMEID